VLMCENNKYPCM